MADDQTIEFNGHTLKYADSNHAYYLDGKRIVSVSTLAKVAYADPGGLMTYAYKHGLAGTDYKEATKFSQECGTAAHDQLEALARTGKPLDLSGQPERVRGALQAVAKWWLEMKPQFYNSEVIVCSVKHRFAGRFDFLAEIDGELVLADLKTSDKDWKHFHRYKSAAAYAQLAGYELAWLEMSKSIARPDYRAILHVNTSGDYDWKPDLAPEYSEASFLSKVTTYRAEKDWMRAYDAAEKAAQLILTAEHEAAA